MYKMKIYLALFFGLLVLAVLGLLIDKHWEDRKTALESKDWLTTQGEILSIEKTELNHKKTTTYRTILEYAYTVDGLAYQSSRYSFSDPYLDSNSQENSNSYFVGNSITVHYDPQDPNEAVLKKDGVAVLTLYIIVELLLGVIVIVTLIFKIKGQSKKYDPAGI